MKQVDLVLTTKCSLRCKECANLMQYYEKPYDVDKNSVFKAVEEFIKYVDEIEKITLIGGEPFLARDLEEIILFLKKIPKVRKIQIFTNGTIVPSKALLKTLAEQKVEIIVSDYGNVSRNKHQLKDICKAIGVLCYLKTEDLQWGYVGDMHKRNRDHKALIKQFKKCNNHCRTILNGKLFYCPRAAHGMDLKIVSTPDRNYINLLEKDRVDKTKIKNFVYSLNGFAACDYCNYGTDEMIAIKPGVQMNIGETRKDY